MKPHSATAKDVSTVAKSRKHARDVWREPNKCKPATRKAFHSFQSSGHDDRDPASGNLSRTWTAPFLQVARRPSHTKPGEASVERPLRHRTYPLGKSFPQYRDWHCLCSEYLVVAEIKINKIGNNRLDVRNPREWIETRRLSGLGFRTQCCYACSGRMVHHIDSSCPKCRRH
jgi:hypothetical protein